jgi:hypothetical protein
MLHVDALSQNPVEEPVGSEDIDVFTMNISEDDWVLAAQLQDQRLKYVREVLLRTHKTAKKKIYKAILFYEIIVSSKYRLRFTVGGAKNGETSISHVEP